jgi:hypothetical protein
MQGAKNLVPRTKEATQKAPCGDAGEPYMPSGGGSGPIRGAPERSGATGHAGCAPAMDKGLPNKKKTNPRAQRVRLREVDKPQNS